MFSVVIPCHNDGEFLQRSIGSVADQLGPDDEVIVVDDGSEPAIDGDALNAAFPNVGVQVLRQKQGGVSRARNEGMALARGEYLVLLDADDELLPGALERYAQHIEAHQPRWMIAAHEWQRGQELTVRTPDLSADQETLFAEFLGKRLHVGNLSCMCLHRETTQSIGFAEHLKVGEDRVLICVLMALHAPALVPTPCARVHRREEGSLRSVSTLEDTQTSQMNATLFEHPLLPSAYQRFAAPAEIRHCRAVLRHSWKERDGAVFQRWHSRLLDLQPRAALEPKLWWRRIWLRLRA